MGLAAVLALGLAALAGQAVESPSVDLRNRVVALTGSSPRECGLFQLRKAFEGATRNELEAAVRCARQAVRDGQPFWTANQRQGIDSWVAHGLLRTSDGALHFFVYDSAPCGGPNCRGELSLEPCREVAVKPAADGEPVDFTCR